eukprot:jgi/Phyca11/17066/fgenesh1_pg.PHYCAscaffold_24_\
MISEPTAVFSARECDALKDEDVTPLPASQPHVVFRLRREEDEHAPWIVELVFLLFNAQVVRGTKPPENSGDRTANTTSYFGEGNFRATRAKWNEADEREVIRFCLSKFHPFVEVVGCLVTYLEDEIARAPQLNAFSLTCDFHAIDNSQAEAEAQALAAGGKRFFTGKNLWVVEQLQERFRINEKLAAEKKVGEKQQDVFESLEVLDADHVPARNALAIASSDLCISLWSVIDATVGSVLLGDLWTAFTQSTGHEDSANRVTVWSANSGTKIEEPVTIRDAEVCAIAFDSPRERKLYVATNKTIAHDGTVTSLIFCSHANCLISTGDDRMICVLDSPPGKSKLEVMHYVEKAHKSSITSPSSLI